MPDPDDLTATLSGAKRRHRRGYTSNPRRDYCYADNQDWPCDVSRVIAAVEAALKLADEWKTFAAPGDAQDECADELRVAITATLTGEETGRD